MNFLFKIFIVSLLSVWVVVASVADDMQAGELLVRQRCAVCHTLQEGVHKIGPSLSNVYGRAAASATGYVYSAALMGSALTWTDESLNQFLENPTHLVPGTKMAIRVPEEDARLRIITFLKAQSQSAKPEAKSP